MAQTFCSEVEAIYIRNIFPQLEEPHRAALYIIRELRFAIMLGFAELPLITHPEERRRLDRNIAACEQTFVQFTSQFKRSGLLDRLDLRQRIILDQEFFTVPLDSEDPAR